MIKIECLPHVAGTFSWRSSHQDIQSLLLWYIAFRRRACFDLGESSWEQVRKIFIVQARQCEMRTLEKGR